MTGMGHAAEKPQQIGQAVGQERWHLLLSAYRDVPGNHSNAARAAHVDRRTARRLYERGDGRNPWSVRPIREVLLGEQQAATARAAAAAAMAAAPATPDEVRAAREAAVETMAEEAKLLRYARGNVQALLNLTTVLSATALKLADRVARTLESEAFLKDMTLAQALLTLNRVAGIVQKGIYAAESVTGMERDILGSPEERAGRAPGSAGKPQLTQVEALEELGRAAELHEMLARRNPELTLLRGGKDMPIKLVIGEGGPGAAGADDTTPAEAAAAPADEAPEPEALPANDTPAAAPCEPEGDEAVDAGDEEGQSWADDTEGET